MKRLILLRHGKSDWAVAGQSDRARGLTIRGEKAAKLVGRLLAGAELAPDLALSSPAVRARTTLELAARAGGWSCPLVVVDGLYEANVDSVLAILRQQPDTASCLLLAGHEPTWSELAGELLGRARVRMPTAATVAIDFEIAAWRELARGTGELQWLLPPRLLAGLEGEG